MTDLTGLQERRIRIVTGPALVVESQLERLVDDYAPQVWNFSVVGAEVHVSVVLVSNKEIRKAALATAAMPVNHRR